MPERTERLWIFALTKNKDAKQICGKEDHVKKKKRNMKNIVVVIILAALVLFYYYHLSSRQGEPNEETYTESSAVKEVLA